MGEKPLINIFEVLKQVQNGNILVDTNGGERFKIVFKESEYNLNSIKTFLRLLEKVTEEQIKAYMRVVDNKECELFIHI
ncbi:MAG: hypothetical protein OdinLCB4_000150 [Candidatus Odinarchaeum yellowstonii]|uniref:Uncharacterized protein n=1 Tax=Odinarchaeota yellowstonii (strain LCB_4) TaxID=1841599 RepID=A0AAF0D2D4_ODILC|nr:MAG: hypothetical protein OdinLCB4_000150 [Candidatus Odinarchaeum yellowstonii]